MNYKKMFYVSTCALCLTCGLLLGNQAKADPSLQSTGKIIVTNPDTGNQEVIFDAEDQKRLKNSIASNASDIIDIQDWMVEKELELGDIGDNITEIEGDITELNDSLVNENNESFNFGVKDGVRGFYTDPSRADDSFIPFISNLGMHLYYHGNEFEFTTGGWNDDFLVNDSHTITPHVKTDKYLHLVSTDVSNTCSCTTVKKIDLTNYNSLKATCIVAGGNFWVTLSKDRKHYSEDSIVYNTIASAGKYVDDTVDLSNVTGEYYITFHISNKAGRYAKIYDVWLE